MDVWISNPRLGKEWQDCRRQMSVGNERENNERREKEVRKGQN
jgi:hypothetical protein